MDKTGKENLVEIKAFFEVVINMALIKKANLKLYWDINHPCASTPWFVTLFNHDHFQLNMLNTNEHKSISRINFMMAVVENLAGGYLPFKVISKRQISREMDMARSMIVPYPLPQCVANKGLFPLFGHNCVKIGAGKIFFNWAPNLCQPKLAVSVMWF